MNQSVIYELNASDIGCGREYPAAYDTPKLIAPIDYYGLGEPYRLCSNLNICCGTFIFLAAFAVLTGSLVVLALTQGGVIPIN